MNICSTRLCDHLAGAPHAHHALRQRCLLRCRAPLFLRASGFAAVPRQDRGDGKQAPAARVIRAWSSGRMLSDKEGARHGAARVLCSTMPLRSLSGAGLCGPRPITRRDDRLHEGGPRGARLHAVPVRGRRLRLFDSCRDAQWKPSPIRAPAHRSHRLAEIWRMHGRQNAGRAAQQPRGLGSPDLLAVPLPYVPAALSFSPSISRASRRAPKWKR
jgi:hypothetical protein